MTKFEQTDKQKKKNLKYHEMVNERRTDTAWKTARQPERKQRVKIKRKERKEKQKRANKQEKENVTQIRMESRVLMTDTTRKQRYGGGVVDGMVIMTAMVVT